MLGEEAVWGPVWIVCLWRLVGLLEIPRNAGLSELVSWCDLG